MTKVSYHYDCNVVYTSSSNCHGLTKLMSLDAIINQILVHNKNWPQANLHVT